MVRSRVALHHKPDGEYNNGARALGIEDHVWFEDRWMVASWCDE
jgi:hypothetical protein